MEDCESLVPIFIVFLCSLLDVGNGDGSDFKMEVIVDGAVVYTLVFNAPMDAKVCWQAKSMLAASLENF